MLKVFYFTSLEKFSNNMHKMNITKKLMHFIFPVQRIKVEKTSIRVIQQSGNILKSCSAKGKRVNATHLWIRKI